MKLTFFSNFMNHHQLFISQAFFERLGEDYTFVATEQIPQERVDMGYVDMNRTYPFVLTTYDSEENLRKAYALAQESDVVILGSAPNSFLTKRLREGKLTFKYCERLFKQEETRVYHKLKNYLRVVRHFGRFQKYPLYGLCASAYTAADVNTYAQYEGRLYRWGYFPQVVEQPDIEALIQKKEPKSLLWVGRMLDWKHPRMAIDITKRLKEEGYQVQLKMIGNGPLEYELKQKIKKENLTDSVVFLGPMSPDQVRCEMEKSQIFLFTSGFKEGWGAVLNEAMNSGCICVVSHATGSGPFLIENGKNGWLYQKGNREDCYKKVKEVLEHPEKMQEMGGKAYRTIRDLWNPTIAAERFLSLSEGLLKGEVPVFGEGPCSQAENLENDWLE